MRVEHIGDATLYLGDCLEIMPTLDKVDAVITDPPYGIGFKYESSYNDTADGYGEWLWNILSLAEAKCQPLSPIFVFQAMLNVRKFSEWFPRKYRIFAAAKNFVQMRPIAMQYAFDPVVVWWTDGQGRPWSKGTNNRDWFVANTASEISNHDNLEKGHPCPRPLDLMIHIVQQWVRPYSIVLDPFMGSGTTGVACANLGRKFIGIEIEEKYFDIACKRIETAYSQPRLFDDLEDDKSDPVEQELGLEEEL